VPSTQPLSGAALDQQFESIVLGRASIEFPCPRSDLTAQPLGGYAYRVTGCDAYATYECDYDSATGNNQSSGGADDNFWIYTCDRAAQDNPERMDAGSG
jgi:hypothetical protein